MTVLRAQTQVATRGRGVAVSRLRRQLLNKKDGTCYTPVNDAASTAECCAARLEQRRSKP